MRCVYCRSNPGTKLNSIVWLGFLDQDTGQKVCFNCKERHYKSKFLKKGLYGLYSETPIVIR